LNPVAVIAHVVAVVLGVFGGFWAIDAVTPDLPHPEQQPGVEVPANIDGADAASLFNPGPLSTAIFQFEEQEGAGTEYASLTLTPETLEASEAEVGGGVEVSDLSVGEPTRVIEALRRERPAISGEVVRQMDLVATSDGLKWLVQLESNEPRLDPPWQYVVPYGRDEVQAGGPLPRPLAPGG
jgi:hypothetical protein